MCLQVLERRLEAQRKAPPKKPAPVTGLGDRLFVRTEAIACSGQEEELSEADEAGGHTGGQGAHALLMSLTCADL